MIRPRHLAAILCLVALWLQAMAPAVAAAMPRGADPFSVICSQVETATGTERKVPTHKPCDQCMLCHASAADVAADWRPVFTSFDFPIVSPLRWALRDPVVLDRRKGESAKPRGPPRLV